MAEKSDRSRKRDRYISVVTKIGLMILGLTLLDLIYVLGHQFIATGSILKGSGWASPQIFRLGLLYGVAISLGVLLMGSIIDTILDRRR